MRFLYISVILTCAVVNDRVLGCYTSIISFGDSLADTGNRIFYDQHTIAKNYPYGETFFHRPTGRSSDGRLVIDFLAQALGLPLIPPYLGHTTPDFRYGVNFAVGGATALDSAFFWERGIHVTTNYTLGVQVGWFKEILPSLCNSSNFNCQDIFQKALFLVGEIGGNDYNHPFLDRKNVEEIKTFAPKVIAKISSTITALIHAGAGTLLVPGYLPIGCSASYLTLFQSRNLNDYDAQTGCLNWLNKFSQFHNRLLQNELRRLRQLHPDVTIVYADYYHAVMELYRFPTQLGFRRDVLAACCGGGGRYNFSLSSVCGSQGSIACDDPSIYVSWDGFHLTEAAYKWIATALIEGSFIIPRINVSCIPSHSYSIDLSYI